MAFTLEDIKTLEDTCDDEDEMHVAVQKAINSLTAWKFQGSYGRTMMAAIENGYCLLGREATTDYWGNRIPSRFEVLNGTKGSIGYVQRQRGTEYADFIAAID